ncbi:hypothetical protein F3Y22_tig00110747pilonHSYRG00129 [Hibiscus syriacus]|uniref:Phytocyanin domain-containing protein n=1 Tax=Hibiscus syriacus TaxID=106335 RepID=A0A6A2ZVW0_HIBSY|nr:basic blue protein-like [Hibiscus syriacus]KAE8695015.1 hypothetical protein F3Y22_tig00110747pilonHSYRG00129 [Hibiscus syriacus]
MANLILLCFLSIFCFLLTSHAATYVVGETSGWDISTNIDSWASDKRFNVDDVLLFQYSSSHSVNEVAKESFETCNTTNSLRTFSNGNTTVTLPNAGTRYFVCGNKMHCLGGMKLLVNVEDDQTSSPVGAPEAQPRATTPKPSWKNNDPATVMPSSDGFINSGIQSVLIAFLFMPPTTSGLLHI